MAWLTGWSKRKKITLTGGSDGAQTLYQLKLNVTYDSDMQSDFDDLRFTKADGETLIDAWLESKIDSTSAVIWVEFPTTPANTVTEDYYMYYGNSGVSNIWNLDNILETNNFSLISGVVATAEDYYTTYTPAKAIDNNISTAWYDYQPSAHNTWINLQFPNTVRIVKSILKNIDDAASSTTQGHYDLYMGATHILQSDTKTWGAVGDHTYTDEFNPVDGTNFKMEWTFTTTQTSEGVWLEEFETYGFKYVANPATYGFGGEEIESLGNSLWYYNLLKRRN